jgi:phage tail sheath protein FI
LVIDHAVALYRGGEQQRKGIDGLFAFDDVNLVCAPDLMKAYEVLGPERQDEADALVKGVQETILSFCARAHYPFAILDVPPHRDVQAIAEWRMALPGGDTPHGALYYPWIKIVDPADAKKQILIPPSGHIAGVYARSDGQRGVHKAPANELVAGAVDLPLNVTKNEQELLNPIGVNCIRPFPGRGIRIWGARTLAMTDPAWRYINVRRLFSYVEASIERSTQWVVFEPNDQVLWAKVRRDVSAFLRTVWLSGALFGMTPEESFYVKCDEETNLPELRDLGQMVCEIGLAPVKPAEFVIFRFSQWTSEANAAE